MKIYLFQEGGGGKNTYNNRFLLSLLFVKYEEIGCFLLFLSKNDKK